MHRTFLDWQLYTIVGLLLLGILYILAISPPKNFPNKTIVTVEAGSGLAELSTNLKKDGVIRSPLFFRMIVIALRNEYGIQAGDYFLSKPQNAVEIAWRMINAESDLTLTKITIPEGFTTKDISSLFDENFPVFNREVFLSLAEEGYMFPDTYFLQSNVTAGKVIEILRTNYKEKISSLKNEIASSTRSEKEIIIMASILEAEVQTPEDKAVVSGILWKRISIGMPLQVDSDMNTYLSLGLPNKPLNNPGLISIKAAIYPINSEYLYFISDKEGKTHYARTLDEHKRNIQKYL